MLPPLLLLPALLPLLLLPLLLLMLHLRGACLEEGWREWRLPKSSLSQMAKCRGSYFLDIATVRPPWDGEMAKSWPFPMAHGSRSVLTMG